MKVDQDEVEGVSIKSEGSVASTHLTLTTVHLYGASELLPAKNCWWIVSCRWSSSRIHTLHISLHLSLHQVYCVQSIVPGESSSWLAAASEDTGSVRGCSSWYPQPGSSGYPGCMSPYFPILANSFSPSHSLSASDYQPTSLTKTPPRPPPGYSPTSDYSLYSSPTQESSPHHLSDPLTLQSCTVTSPPDYHPTWIPRAPTPPEYSPTSPTYNVFSPPEYVPACPSESHSSSASVPISPPAYHPSWIPKRIVDISEFSQHSSTSSTQSQWEEYVPTRPSHSPKSLPFRHSYPPPYHPTNIPSVATLECSAPYPAYHPYSSYYPHSSKLEEPSLNCRPQSPCYRPTSPNLNPPVYSSRSASPSILPYVPSSGSYVPSGSSSLHAPNPSAMSPTHSLAKSEDDSTSMSYNHPQSEDASTSLSYNPSSLSYTLTAPNQNVKYSPLSPGYSIP